MSFRHPGISSGGTTLRKSDSPNDDTDDNNNQPSSSTGLQSTESQNEMTTNTTERTRSRTASINNNNNTNSRNNADANNNDNNGDHSQRVEQAIAEEQDYPGLPAFWQPSSIGETSWTRYRGRLQDPDMQRRVAEMDPRSADAYLDSISYDDEGGSDEDRRSYVYDDPVQFGEDEEEDEEDEDFFSVDNGEEEEEVQEVQSESVQEIVDADDEDDDDDDIVVTETNIRGNNTTIRQSDTDPAYRKRKRDESETVEILTSDEEEQDDDLIILGSDGETAEKAKSTTDQLKEVTKNSSTNFKDVTCPICFDEIEKCVASPCGHFYCSNCVYKALASSQVRNTNQGCCALCRKTVLYRDLVWLKVRTTRRKDKTRDQVR